jgi:pilus assembly protein CpaF
MNDMPAPPKPTRVAPPPPAPAAPATPLVSTGRHKAYDASLEFFLSPIRPFLDDPLVTEIMVNGPDRVYVERGGRIEKTDARFASEADVEAAANNIAQFVAQPLSQERPILDGRLPDGSRVCIVLSPLALTGTQINIRRFSAMSVTPEFLLQYKAITPEAMEFLLLAVSAYRNIVVSGGAGSGKTTLANILTAGFGAEERIVVIEDTKELQVQREHVIHLEARRPDAYGRGAITVRDLFVSSLRMRPDRVVVGEVRRGEALDMIQAMTSGHHGSMTTVHASSPADTCYRLETMALMADVGIPLFALRRQIASALDLLVHTVRLPSGRRLVSQICELELREESNNYILHDIFVLSGRGESIQLQWTGRRPKLADAVELEDLQDRIKLTRRILQGQAQEAPAT